MWDTLGKRGSLALWSFVIVVQTMTAATCQLACIRSMYSLFIKVVFINSELNLGVYAISRDVRIYFLEQLIVTLSAKLR